jgi:drug/metabolite transporter (DMT)-like permease
VLTDEEKDVANICAGLLTIAVVGAVMLLSYDLNDVEWKNLGTYLLCAGIALTVVVSSIASRTLERSKRRLKICGIIFAIGCGMLIVSALVLPVFALRLFDWLVWGFVGYQFYANAQE